MLSGQSLPFIGGSSDTDFWLTGYGRVVHCLSGTCADTTTPFSGTSTSISLPVAPSASLAFVRVGENQVLRWNGTDWQLDANFPSTEKVYALWKSPQGTIWAAGTAGLQRCVGGVWSKLTLPQGYLLGGVLWGASDTNLSVNADTQSAGRYDTVLTWNGSTWSTWAHYNYSGFTLPGDTGGWSRPVHILRK